MNHSIHGDDQVTSTPHIRHIIHISSSSYGKPFSISIERTTERLSLLHLHLSNSWIASFTLISSQLIDWLCDIENSFLLLTWRRWRRRRLAYPMLMLMVMLKRNKQPRRSREGHLSSRWSFCHASSSSSKPPQKARALTSPKKWLHYVAHGVGIVATYAYQEMVPFRTIPKLSSCWDSTTLCIDSTARTSLYNWILCPSHGGFQVLPPQTLLPRLASNGQWWSHWTTVWSFDNTHCQTRTIITILTKDLSCLNSRRLLQTKGRGSGQDRADTQSNIGPLDLNNGWPPVKLVAPPRDVINTP